MRPRWACGYLCPRQGLPAALGDLRRLACVLAHPQHAVDLSALLDQESLGVHVAVNDTRRLQLDPFLSVDRAAHLAANNRLTAHDVAFHFPAPRDKDLLCRPHRSVHRAFYLYDAVLRDVADDPPPRADD